MKSKSPSIAALLAGDAAEGLVTLAPIDLRPLPDAAAAIRTAIDHPEGFPALVDAVVPGDRVTLAVDSSLPSIVACISGVIEALQSSRCEQLCVLLAEDVESTTVDEIRASVASGVEVCVHDPGDSEELSYLAAGESADPIYLNRQLAEADLVLPLATARPAGGLDTTAGSGGIFPTFADRASQQRLREAFWAARATGKDNAIGKLAKEAAWLLGIQMIVEVLPTVDGQAAQIVAGLPEGIERCLATPRESSWRRSPSENYSLVVASIDGPAQQQTWHNVARAVFTASQLVSPGGTVAVASQLSGPIPPGMRWLAADEPFEDVWQKICQSEDSDGTVVSVLLSVIEQTRVVMLTDHESGIIEDLGIGELADVDAINRLIDQADSAAVLLGAQFCGISETED